MTTKRLTLDDLLKELGELAADDLEGDAAQLKKRQADDVAQLTKQHHAERRALEERVMEVDRRTIELREAIKLARNGMDPLQAIMQTKGTALFVMVGATGMWTLPARD